MAGVALGDIDLQFAWQAWHLWHWAGSGGALGSRLAPWAPRLFAWQAWHWATSTYVLRGRRGTWQHRPSLCVAGVARGDIDPHFAAGVALVALPGRAVQKDDVAGVKYEAGAIYDAGAAWHARARKHTGSNSNIYVAGVA